MGWEARLRQAVEKCWQHHGRCESIAWWSERDIFDGEIYFAAPVQQEIRGGAHDGTLTWTGFRFDLTTFLKTEGMTVEKLEVASVCHKCCPHPAMECVGTFEGEPFILITLLEPKYWSEAAEVIDTNNLTLIKKEPNP